MTCVTPTLLRRIHHIKLRVHDLERSVEFYHHVLGLERRPTLGTDGCERICTSPSTGPGTGFAIVLSNGLPAGMPPMGVDHFGFEVGGVPEVVDICRAAMGAGALVVGPRLYDGCFQTFIFDPDGYKIEVLAGEET